MTKITLYNYWRSSASWRVRIALAAKKIPYNYEVVNIINGDQVNRLKSLFEKD